MCGDCKKCFQMASITTRSKSRHQFQIESQSIDECGVFNVVETKYDGDCLFSAILDFTRQNANVLNNTPQFTNQLRLQTVEYILSRNSIGFQENWNRFLDNIKYNLETRIPCLSQYGKNSKNDESIKQSYSIYMKKSGNFGTFSELCAAAEFYGFTGYIFQINEANEYSCYDFGLTGNQQIDKKKPQIFLLFTGPVDSGHFRRLEPSIAPVTILTGKYQLSESISQS